jgi:hypothetical protein
MGYTAALVIFKNRQKLGGGTKTFMVCDFFMVNFKNLKIIIQNSKKNK